MITNLKNMNLWSNKGKNLTAFLTKKRIEWCIIQFLV